MTSPEYPSEINAIVVIGQIGWYSPRFYVAREASHRQVLLAPKVTLAVLVHPDRRARRDLPVFHRDA
jgi:hypothetical protein